jgi:hypothetical protein
MNTDLSHFIAEYRLILKLLVFYASKASSSALHSVTSNDILAKKTLKHNFGNFFVGVFMFAVP